MSGAATEHVLARLKEIGLFEVSGALGEYGFPGEGAIVNSPGMQW